MFFFSSINKNFINYDYSRKVNLKNYQKLKSTRGETLNLSVINSGLIGLHQIKVLLVLELLSLQKAFTHFELNKSAKRRKAIFVPQESRVFLVGKYYDYFLYTFSKNSIGLIKNLLAFYNLNSREFSTKMLLNMPEKLRYGYVFDNLKLSKKLTTKIKNLTSRNFEKSALANISFDNQKQDFEINAFDLVLRNNFYFYDLNLKIKHLFPLGASSFSTNKSSLCLHSLTFLLLNDQKLGFYKIKL